MESRPTILIAMFVVLGGAFLAMFQQGSGAEPVALSQPALSAPKEDQAGKVLAESCALPPWPMLPLCEKFQPLSLVDSPEAAPKTGASDAARGSGKWALEGWLALARTKTRFVIATVPDPELTRLSLYFDRAMDSVQRAAESTGFYLDRHWLPWTRDASGGTRAASFTGDEPGMLLFRRPGASEEYLVVFLVGESPISGIRQRSFLKAVQYAHAVARPSTFYVSGTSYSGALPSLRHGIEDARRLFLSGDSRDGNDFEVVSGSATVKDEMDAFRSGTGEGASPITFASVMHNDTFASEYFLEYMSRRWWGPVPSAFLSEGQTAYGIGSGTIQREMGSTGNETVISRTIRFPREIARLRGAYPQPAAPSVPAGIAGEGTSGAQLSVPLGEVREGRDAVTIFSGVQLPVVQEAVLLDIANTLQREDIRLAGVAATDVFDSLFLASFLRKATPSVRIYLDDVDLLYVRAGAQYSLEGVLAITTYPLVTQNQLWSLGRTENQLRQRSPTSSRFELGMFNATRALLLKQESARLNAESQSRNQAQGQESQPRVAIAPAYGGAGKQWPDLVDHTFPGEEYDRRPPLWLVAVGFNGYWPIAILDQGKTDTDQLAWGPSASRASKPVLDLGRPGRVWCAMFAILVVVGGIFGCLTVMAQLPGFPERLRRTLRRKREPRESHLWGQFLVHPAERGAPGRAYFISAQCLAFSAMLYPVASPLWLLLIENICHPTGVLHVSPENWLIPAAMLSLATFLVLVAGAFAPFALLISHHARRRTAPEGEGPLRGNQYIHLGIATLAAFPFPLVFWWCGLAAKDDHSLFFFAYRSIDLLNGVSPATPFLLLGVGLLVMARLHARRHALTLEAPTELPQIVEDFQTKGLRADTKAVAQSLSNPLTSDVGATALILVPAIAICFLIPWDWPQSLESWQYDVAYQIMLRALFAFAAISWARFVLAWIKLRRVLETLDLHPMRATFSVLPSGYTQVPVIEGSGTLDSRDRLVRVAQDLRSLACCPNVERIDFLAPAELRKFERRIESAIGKDQRELANVWRDVARIGTELAERLEPEWRKGCGTVDDAILRRNDVPANQRAYRIAEEIVAMPYLAFLGNAMLQLRNLLFYVTTSYFLGVMSALVYPLRGVQMIVWAATLGFVVLGIPVIVALIQMERDEILRRLTRSKEEPGAFRLLRRLAGFGALPILAMLGSYFPGIGRYLITWLEPALKAL